MPKTFSFFLFMLILVSLLGIDGMLFLWDKTNIFGFFHLWPSFSCVLILLLSKQWSLDFLRQEIDLVFYRIPRFIFLFLIQLFFVFVVHVLRILIVDLSTIQNEVFLFVLYSLPVIALYLYPKSHLNHPKK